MNLSINMAPLPKADFASETALEKFSSSSDILRTTLIPRPPPPYAAFKMMGRPFF